MCHSSAGVRASSALISRLQLASSVAGAPIHVGRGRRHPADPGGYRNRTALTCYPGRYRTEGRLPSWNLIAADQIIPLAKSAETAMGDSSGKRQTMKTPVDTRRIFAYMTGLWQFSREVRSSERAVIALVEDGKASFLSLRNCTEVQDTGNIHSWSENEADKEGPAEPSLNNNKTETLLYREYGLLNNITHPSAKGPVTRQFWYERISNDTIQSFNSTMRVKSAKQQDPWNIKFDQKEVDKLDFFHDLVFTKAEDGEQALSPENSNVKFDLSGCTAKTLYACEPDMYEGHFAILDDDHMTVTWAVSGPQKAYTIESKFKRKMES